MFRAAFIDTVTLITILTAIVALLQTVAGLELVPPEIVPYLLLAVALLNVVIKFLRGEPLSLVAARLKSRR